MSAIDDEFMVICRQIQNATKKEKWLCPECKTELTYRFQPLGNKVRTAKRTALSVSCKKCGMDVALDGNFEMPAWYNVLTESGNERPI